MLGEEDANCAAERLDRRESPNLPQLPSFERAEAADSFPRHLDPAHRHAWCWAEAENGRTGLLIGDRVFRMIANPT